VRTRGEGASPRENNERKNFAPGLSAPGEFAARGRLRVFVVHAAAQVSDTDERASKPHATAYQKMIQTGRPTDHQRASQQPFSGSQEKRTNLFERE